MYQENVVLYKQALMNRNIILIKTLILCARSCEEGTADHVRSFHRRDLANFTLEFDDHGNLQFKKLRLRKLMDFMMILAVH